MNPPPDNAANALTATAGLIARRSFLPLLIMSMGTLGFSLSFFWRRGRQVAPPPEIGIDSLLQPRFRLNRVKYFLSQLESGFYLYPSQVIHYVSADRKLRGVTYIDEGKMVRHDLDTAQRNADPSRPRPHLNRAHASISFELEALSLFRGKQVDKACELLAYAVAEDLLRVSTSGGKPSLRLYDLLAGVALRNGRRQYLDEMVRRIDDAARGGSREQQLSGPAASVYASYMLALQARVRKWRDPRSNWYKRWSDRTKSVEWKLDKDNGLVF